MNETTTKYSKCYCYADDQAYPKKIETHQVMEGVWTIDGERDNIQILNCGHAVHRQCQKTIANLAKTHLLLIPCPNCTIRWRASLLPMQTKEVSSSADAETILLLRKQLQETSAQYEQLQNEIAPLKAGSQEASLYKMLFVAMAIIVAIQIIDSYLFTGERK